MTTSDPAVNTTRPGSVPAIERATGQQWASWLELFASHQAEQLTHAQIAQIARSHMPAVLNNPDWWAQAVAIAFEQHAGLRVPGQGTDGLFRVSASRTVSLDRDAAIDAWIANYGEATEHRGYAVAKGRRSRTDKRSFWRMDLTEAGRVEVSATPKSEDRVTLAVNHEGLPTGEEIELWRGYWKQLLGGL